MGNDVSRGVSGILATKTKKEPGLGWGGKLVLVCLFVGFAGAILYRLRANPDLGRAHLTLDFDPKSITVRQYVCLPNGGFSVPANGIGDAEWLLGADVASVVILRRSQGWLGRTNNPVTARVESQGKELTAHTTYDRGGAYIKILGDYRSQPVEPSIAIYGAEALDPVTGGWTLLMRIPLKPLPPPLPAGIRNLPDVQCTALPDNRVRVSLSGLTEPHDVVRASLAAGNTRRVAWKLSRDSSVTLDVPADVSKQGSVRLEVDAFAFSPFEEHALVKGLHLKSSSGRSVFEQTAKHVDFSDRQLPVLAGPGAAGSASPASCVPLVINWATAHGMAEELEWMMVDSVRLVSPSPNDIGVGAIDLIVKEDAGYRGTYGGPGRELVESSPPVPTVPPQSDASKKPHDGLLPPFQLVRKGRLVRLVYTRTVMVPLHR